jgi:hypothetical protein
MTQATIRIIPNDDGTLEAAAHTLRTVQGVLSVDVDEPAQALHVEHDADVITEGELLTLMGMEGVTVRDLDDR